MVREDWKTEGEVEDCERVNVCCVTSLRQTKSCVADENCDGIEDEINGCGKEPLCCGGVGSVVKFVVERKDCV